MNTFPHITHLNVLLFHLGSKTLCFRSLPYITVAGILLLFIKRDVTVYFYIDMS